MTIKDVRPVEELETLDEVLKETFKSDAFHRIVVTHVKKTGELLRVEVEGNSITYNGRSARLILAVDETEKIAALESIKASEQRFKSLVQDGSDLIAILDRDGKYKYVSPKWKELSATTLPDHFSHQDHRLNCIIHISRFHKRRSISIAATYCG